jgi:hypothetical protein
MSAEAREAVAFEDDFRLDDTHLAGHTREGVDEPPVIIEAVSQMQAVERWDAGQQFVAAAASCALEAAGDHGTGGEALHVGSMERPTHPIALAALAWDDRRDPAALASKPRISLTVTRRLSRKSKCIPVFSESEKHSQGKSTKSLGACRQFA